MKLAYPLVMAVMFMAIMVLLGGMCNTYFDDVEQELHNEIPIPWIVFKDGNKSDDNGQMMYEGE